jgi:transposase
MSTLTFQQATHWQEGRRLRAWELYLAGWKHQAIADALGLTKGAVSQWFKRAWVEGPVSFRYRKRPGSRPKLPAAQQARLPALLERGAEAFGFRGNVWTQPRIAEVIRLECGVQYDPSWGWAAS